MFAVIKTGGKQYRVAADDLIEVDKIAGAAGDAITFSEVLAVGGEEPVFGTPTVAGATVRGEVVEQGRQPKLIAFKKRRRKNSRRKRGHRQEFTRVRITEILAGSPRDQATAAKPMAEPATEKPAARKPKAENAEAAEKPARKSKAETAETAAAEAKSPRDARPPDEHVADKDKSK